MELCFTALYGWEWNFLSFSCVELCLWGMSLFSSRRKRERCLAFSQLFSFLFSFLYVRFFQRFKRVREVDTDTRSPPGSTHDKTIKRICLDLALEIDDGVCKFKMTGLPVCWSSKLHVSCGLGRVKDDLFPHAAKIRTNSFLSEPNKENKCETLGMLAI